jgi:hypothetical protein
VGSGDPSNADGSMLKKQVPPLGLKVLGRDDKTVGSGDPSNADGSMLKKQVPPLGLKVLGRDDKNKNPETAY